MTPIVSCYAICSTSSTFCKVRLSRCPLISMSTYVPMSNTSHVSCRSLASGGEPLPPSWLRLEQTCLALPQPSISPPGLGLPQVIDRAGASACVPLPTKAISTCVLCWLKSFGSFPRTFDNYLSAQYHRLARREGSKRAIVAVSHSVLTIIYHMLRANQDYHDLGPH